MINHLTSSLTPWFFRIGRLDPARFQDEDGNVVGFVLSISTALMIGLAVLFVSAKVVVPDAVTIERILNRVVHIEW
jgi:hypothetical protein